MARALNVTPLPLVGQRLRPQQAGIPARGNRVLITLQDGNGNPPAPAVSARRHTPT